VKLTLSEVFIPLAAFVSFLTFTTAQTSTEPSGVKVEIELVKRQFSVGERVKFRALLINRGPSAVYVSKRFSRAGGGSAGFYVHVKQRTGKLPSIGCVSATDLGPEREDRSPEQILKEDFLSLPAGGMIGYEAWYDGCRIENPGNYEIKAEYSAQDLNQGKVKSFKIEDASVLAGQYESNPVVFSVTRESRSDRPNN
jgi:hypothetical protein